MISYIRSLINSKFGAIFALLFIGMIAIAFALGDVSGSGNFGGLSGGNVARVGDRNITLGELNDALDNRLKAERQNNPTLDMAGFVEGGGGGVKFGPPVATDGMKARAAWLSALFRRPRRPSARHGPPTGRP